MNKYYIRCKQSDWQELLMLGVKLGAITVDDNDKVTAINGGSWDYIGEIHQQTGTTLDDNNMEIPVFSPIVDPSGELLIHANLITPIALGETAISMADSDTDIAIALADLSRFFLLDADGNARLPTNPYRVFAS